MLDRAGLDRTRNNARQEWRDNWPMVFSASMAAGVINTHFYAFGVFVKPLSAATGWSRGEIGLIQLIYSVVTILLGPAVGLLADRVGPRKLAIAGMSSYCLLIASYSLVQHNIWVWYLLGFFNAAAALFCNATILTMAITRRFRSALGLALSVVLAGSGLYASSIVPVLATALIKAYDFRVAYVVLGLVGLGLSLPLLVLFFDRAAGEVPASSPPAVRAAGDWGDVRRGVRGRYFWRLGVAAFLVQIGTTGLLAHFIPILTDIGMTPARAAGIASLVGVMSLVSRLGAGWFLDRFHAPSVGFVCFLAPMVASGLLLLAGSHPVLSLLAAPLLGMAVGAETDIVAFMLVKYVGAKGYGMTFGILYGLCSLGTGVGVAIAGSIFDQFGSYDLALYVFMGATAIATFLIASLGRYPNRSQKPGFGQTA